MDTTSKAIDSRSGMMSLRIALALASLLTCHGWCQQVGSGDGLMGSYFDNRFLSGDPVTERVEGQVDFDWGVGAPPGLTNADEFSARWTGEL